MKEYLFILKNSPFFSGLTAEEIFAVLKCVDARITIKKKGEYLFRSGESTASMGLVLSGTVLVIQEDLWGRRNIMSRVEAGGLLAEAFAAVPGSVLNVSVEAVEESKILLLDVGRLLLVCPAACTRHNRLVRNLVSVLAGKILLFNDKITHMSKRSTRDKLLSYLSSESLRQGKLSFDIPYDRQQLADYLCVDRAAMSAEISKLQKEGMLKTERKHFELLPGCGGNQCF